MTESQELAPQPLPAVREMPSFSRAARIGIVVELEDGTIHTLRCDDVSDVTMTMENDWAESGWMVLGAPELLSTTLGVTFKPRRNSWHWRKEGGQPPR